MEGIVGVVVLHLKGSLVVVVLNVLMSASEQQYSGTAVLRRAITHTGQRSPSPSIQSQRRCYGGLACTGLYWSVLACTGLQRPATAFTGLYWPVLYIATGVALSMFHLC